AFLAEVDSRHLGATARHRLGEDAAAAADVEHLLAGEASGSVDPFQAQRVDLVQRPELALRVPPAVRELREFLEFCGVRVHRIRGQSPKMVTVTIFLQAARSNGKW